ncbi:MAG: electron transport complex subunit RsxG [Gammaproteobacteria bacterium]|nr:MAG: electron transport complex subunit RsxG [Gammaproteobacteria bacterium]
MQSALKLSLRASLWLTGFALIAVLALAVTDRLSAPAIAEQERAALLRDLHQLIPADIHDNDLLGDTITVKADALLGTDEDQTGWRVIKNGKTVGIAFTVIAPDGYNGDIRLLVAINDEGKLLGVRALSHRETPGLGDGIDIRKSSWIRQFENRSLSDPEPAFWKVKKDNGIFDQFTGATITPRAVVKAVKKSLEYFAANKDSLLGNKQ